LSSLIKQSKLTNKQKQNNRIEGTPVLLDHAAKLPSKRLRHGLAWGYAALSLVIQWILIGVLGHYESDPNNIQISDRLFKASLAIVAFGPAIIFSFLTFFGYQFLGVISKALKEMDKQGSTTTQSEVADQTIQIRLVMNKVTYSCSLLLWLSSISSFLLLLDFNAFLLYQLHRTLRLIVLTASLTVLQCFLMAFYDDFYTNLLCSKAFVVLFVFAEAVLYFPALVLSVVL